MTVYRHQKAPCWQYDFQMKGYRFCGSTDIPKEEPKEKAALVEAEKRAAARRFLNFEIGATVPAADTVPCTPFVYFMRSGRNVKIGVSVDPFARMATIQTGNPRKISLLATIPGGFALESAIHREFKDYAINGEWFRLQGALSDYVNRLRARPGI